MTSSQAPPSPDLTPVPAGSAGRGPCARKRRRAGWRTAAALVIVPAAVIACLSRHTFEAPPQPSAAPTPSVLSQYMIAIGVSLEVLDRLPQHWSDDGSENRPDGASAEPLSSDAR